jgi:hypothetical protein
MLIPLQIRRHAPQRFANPRPRLQAFPIQATPAHLPWHGRQGQPSLRLSDRGMTRGADHQPCRVRGLLRPSPHSRQDVQLLRRLLPRGAIFCPLLLRSSWRLRCTTKSVLEPCEVATDLFAARRRQVARAQGHCGMAGCPHGLIKDFAISRTSYTIALHRRNLHRTTERPQSAFSASFSPGDA